MKAYILGVDIGGTNTDAVLVDNEQRIVAQQKVTTSPNIVDGFAQAIEKVMKQVPPCAIERVIIGTTHATNAILQRTELYRVGLIRIAGHRPTSIPSACAWPQDLRDAVLAGMVTIDGGFECDGRPITRFDPAAVYSACEVLLAQGAQSIALVGTFAPMNNTQECQAFAVAATAGVPVSMSHTIGSLGFIERENATILNAALKKTMRAGFERLAHACAQWTSAPLFITQNNGTLMSLDDACAYPILTIAAGPTNSFIGGARLGGGHDAIVVDIGGTSTDVGIVINGFARRSMHTSSIGGVALNFPMPDVLSIGLGGGSFVSGGSGSSLTIGPRSCASKLLQQTRACGGSILTLSDAAVALGLMNLDGGLPEKTGLSPEQARAIVVAAQEKVRPLLVQIAGPRKNLPVVVVGGGAVVLKDIKSTVIPEHAAVANAYGAACAQVAATVDTVVSLQQRDAVLDKLRQQVCEQAYAKGAQRTTVRLVQQEIIPYSYIPGALARVIMTAAGSLK
jgi:N-methylhydantoinase A/oxoprolinase/acetone carboxylase beta subunit